MSEKYAPRSDDPWDKEKEDNLRGKEKEKERKTWLNKIGLSNLAEPTIMIAFVTATFYMSISGYYISYFQRVSIPFYALDLPFTFYLNAGNSILYALYHLIFFATIIESSKYAMNIYKNGARDKKFLLMLISFIFFSTIAIIYVMNLIKNVFLICSILYLALYIYGFPYRYYKDKNYVNLGSTLLLAILICLFIPSLFGTYNAERLILGDAGSLEVKLNFDNKSYDILNKTLMLVIHSDNKYYLVEKNKSLPKEVNLYIIPDNQIKMITIKPVEKKQRKFYEFYKDWRLI